MARGAARASFPRLTGVVTIAGGGLAGLSLAAGLRLRGIPVEVHEAGSYPRHRVCGEFISGVKPETLQSLGILHAFDGSFACSTVEWSRGGKKIHEDRLPEPAMGISRHRLDQRLRDHVVVAGGIVNERSRLSREPRDGLVWAAGRIPSKSPWVGLKCHFLQLEMKADLEMHLGTNGYVGLAKVEDGRVNVCGLFHVDRSRRTTGAGLLIDYLRAGGNELLAKRMEAAAADPESFSAVAGFELGRQAAEPGLCVLGDAESMIPPFTGNGMSMAFEAAAITLDPLEKWSRGGMEWDDCVAEISSRLRLRFRRRLAAAQALHPVLLHSGGRHLIEAMARARILPFRPLLSLVR